LAGQKKSEIARNDSYPPFLLLLFEYFDGIRRLAYPTEVDSRYVAGIFHVTPLHALSRPDLGC